MNELHAFINRTLRFTFLSGREKAVLREEMERHLLDSMQTHIASGMNEVDARKAATDEFGSVREIRRKLHKETFGIHPSIFLIGVIISLLGLIFAVFLDMRVGDWNPITHQPIVTPAWMLEVSHYFPMSFYRWIALGVLSFIMLFTRNRKDRAGVLAAILPFLSVWVFLHIRYALRPENFIPTPLYDQPPVAAFVQIVLVSITGVLIYLWTKNVRISLTPWILSTALTLYPPVRDAVQASLWQVTHILMFWGHEMPFLPRVFTQLSVQSVLMVVPLFIAILLRKRRSVVSE